MTEATWGYSKDEAKIFDLAEGDTLPDGFYRHPSMIPDAKPNKPVLKLPEKKA